MSDIIRRDPRAEWIVRNRLHPLHLSLVKSQQGDVRGPSGLLRKNVRDVGFIGPNGIKRIDRANLLTVDTTTRRSASKDTQTARPLHVVEQADFYIMVVADMVGGRLTAHDKDLLGQAHRLVVQYSDVNSQCCGAVALVCFGQIKDDQLGLSGVDRLFHLEDTVYDGFSPEARLGALQQIESQYQPLHWLFPDSVHGGADLACRFSARIGERLAAHVWQLDREQCLSRGASGSMDIKRATPRIVTLLEECADPIEDTQHQALPMVLEPMAVPSARLKEKGQMAVDASAVPLAEAEFILSAGNGIHNWAQFHATATALGATEGASRVAVDEGFMPRARQVGASGTWVTARVYVAVGISGAIQHMQGIGQCDKVIAINTDAGCDMVKRADLAVIADSDALLMALASLVEQHQLAKHAEQIHGENSNAA
ncbi:electron transfer flavoprotein subunit alpha/FixB family protein [Marinomonas sp. A79]|uniref:Electron transfer flavoprotein subunit alpha/FixB family protein n=1 Tax=Marinomonas vulgaris TaxID=2823372 RepID=A0ABS5HBG1_9GAMM|nr:electron transfer flavoprotein subunit alpha/FixB family protein [Marinomonas vulgaris]MBR7888988.1 electron transfer flavoprotein subunit alpha/FixB family protein [Marinomonas vulgaris]